MDTLPSSVSTFKIPIQPPPSSSSSSRDFHHYLRTPTKRQTQFSSSSTKLPHPSSISTTNLSSHNLRFPFSSSSREFLSSSQSQSLKQSTALIHHRAAAGYAAALVDVCRRNDTIEAVERDVRRFARLMRNEQIRAIMADPSLDESGKGDLVKEIAEKGRFQRHLVDLLKMMIAKNRLGIVDEALRQFRDFHRQLRGTMSVNDDYEDE